jgi:hypothetical protein
LGSLESAGYHPSAGIIAEPTWTDSSNYSIKATGHPSRGLGKKIAEMNVVSGVAMFVPAQT